MIHTAYKLVQRGLEVPYIEKVEYTNPEGVSWREAKKQLRQWYLDQAGAIRGLTEVTYFEQADEPASVKYVDFSDLDHIADPNQ